MRPFYGLRLRCGLLLAPGFEVFQPCGHPFSDITHERVHASGDEFLEGEFVAGVGRPGWLSPLTCDPCGLGGGHRPVHLGGVGVDVVGQRRRRRQRNSPVVAIVQSAVRHAVAVALGVHDVDEEVLRVVHLQRRGAAGVGHGRCLEAIPGRDAGALQRGGVGGRRDNRLDGDRRAVVQPLLADERRALLRERQAIAGLLCGHRQRGLFGVGGGAGDGGRVGVRGEILRLQQGHALAPGFGRLGALALLLQARGSCARLTAAAIGEGEQVVVAWQLALEGGRQILGVELPGAHLVGVNQLLTQFAQQQLHIGAGDRTAFRLQFRAQFGGVHLQCRRETFLAAHGLQPPVPVEHIDALHPTRSDTRGCIPAAEHAHADGRAVCAWCAWQPLGDGAGRVFGGRDPALALPHDILRCALREAGVEDAASHRVHAMAGMLEFPIFAAHPVLVGLAERLEEVVRSLRARLIPSAGRSCALLTALALRAGQGLARIDGRAGQEAGRCVAAPGDVGFLGEEVGLQRLHLAGV